MEEAMKRYYIKSGANQVEYFDILKENPDGYTIRVIRIHDGYEKKTEASISRHLFNICVKTGYIYAAEKSVSSVA